MIIYDNPYLLAFISAIYSKNEQQILKVTEQITKLLNDEKNWRVLLVGLEHDLLKKDKTARIFLWETLLRVLLRYNFKSIFRYIINNEIIALTALEVPLTTINNTQPIYEPEHSLQEFYGDGITQQEFINYRYKIASEICDAVSMNQFSLSLKKSVDPNVLTLYKLGKYRARISRLSDPYSFDQFGVPRNYELNTPLWGRYRPYLEQLCNQALSNKNEKLNIWHYEILKTADIAIISDISVTINNETLHLTGTSIRDGDCSWVHTHHKYIPAILQYCSHLLKNITKSRIDINDEDEIQLITESIAELHWFLAHAAVFNRGSAAVTEWIVSGLFQYHGLKVDWSEMADCQALIQADRHKYMENYHLFANVYKNTADRLQGESQLYLTQYNLFTNLAHLQKKHKRCLRLKHVETTYTHPHPLVDHQDAYQQATHTHIRVLHDKNKSEEDTISKRSTCVIL